MSSYDKEKKSTTAKRLKELRKKKKLSHVTLANELTDKYNIEISKDVLINYEIESEHHTRFKAGFGMNIRYIYCLADFYGVSTDYLLGRIDEPTADIKVLRESKLTGLSGDSVFNLKMKKIYDSENGDMNLPILNYLIEKDIIWDIIDKMLTIALNKAMFEMSFDDDETEAIWENENIQKWEFSVGMTGIFVKIIPDILKRFKEPFNQLAKKRIIEMDTFAKEFVIKWEKARENLIREKIKPNNERE